jgi:hypothetical protein
VVVFLCIPAGWELFRFTNKTSNLKMPLVKKHRWTKRQKKKYGMGQNVEWKNAD